MDHQLSPAGRAVVKHFAALFPEGAPELLAPTPGPIHGVAPGLHILSLTPPEGGRLYATAGLSVAGLEFVLHAPSAEDEVHVETLTMVAYYHAGGGDYVLGLGHTVPIGRPWLPGSSCDHLLVSLPYPWGPQLEICGQSRVLWLLPITAAEKRFRHEHGLEALEQRFENPGIIPTDPYRPGVVA